MTPRHHLGLTTLIVVVLGGPVLAGDEGTPQSDPATRGTDWWRLRSSDVATTGSTGAPSGRNETATAIPDARRAVRVVYPGLTGAR